MTRCSPHNNKNIGHTLLRLGVAVGLALGGAAPHALAEPAHGLAMHGALKHAKDATHFSYVNPNAPKGGRLPLGVIGTFDSLNPLIIKGSSAAGIRGYVYESLMARAYDEPFSLYGLIAESVETPDDRSSVTFTIRKEARFSDGKPVTVDDVVFSFELLKTKGRPNHRTYYPKVAKVEVLPPRSVKFTFDASGDREMPLIMGLMPVLPKHAINPDTFEQTSLTPPVGSGPYKVAEVDVGKRIVYRRDPNYWGANLPANKGRFNFDEIEFQYYRDNNALFESFKKGLTRARFEGDPGKWATDYNFPAVKDGRIKKQAFPIGLPSGMSGLVFNTRRPVFKDPDVRQALIHLFDFEWVNRNLFQDVYTRTQSYFDRSELSSAGKAADARERELLAPFAKYVDAAILDGTYVLPKSDASGRNRKNLRKALRLFRKAGYQLKDGVLRNVKTGQPFTFGVLSVTRSQERLLLTFARSLEAVGIKMDIRQVDAAQYNRRVRAFDFDMIQFTWRASLSPGNEQLFRWSSKLANTEGSFNYAGVNNPAADAMIKALLEARSRDDFVSAVRALDRVLMSGHYVIPLYHLKDRWMAHWKELAFPKSTSLFGPQLDTWWSTKASAQSSTN